MKKRGIGTRIGAIILAAGMIVSDAVPTLATQSAVSEETVISTELAETAEETEAAEETETTEETEAAEGTETTEETEVAEGTEVTEITETTEENEETESTETVGMEETEAVSEEDVLLGSEVGVSQVIGLKGETSSNTMYSDDDAKKKSYVYLTKSQYIDVFGVREDYKDAATGLYRYNDAYYGSGSNYSSYCRLSDKVATIMESAPTRDEETGLYLVDGKYYNYYSEAKDENGNILCCYVKTKNEVDVLGKVASDADIKALYGKKIADSDASICYYEINGRNYKYVYVKSVADGKCVYGYKTDEISFDKKYHTISWKSVTNDTEVSINGKMYYIGYQVRMNGQMTDLTYAMAGGQSITKSTQYTTGQVYAPGEQAVYEVRAVYYTKTRINVTDAQGKVTGSRYEFTIAKTGDWSAAYAYSFTAGQNTQKIGKVTNLTATWKDSNTVELNWDAVAEANYYQVWKITSDTELNPAEFTNADWKSSFYLNSKSTYYDMDVSTKYAYYRVRAYVGYDNEIYDGEFGEYSDVISVTKPDTTELVTVTGLKVDEKADGTFTLTWDKVDENTNVMLYYSTNPSLFSTEEFKYLIAKPYSVEEKEYLVDQAEVEEQAALVKKQYYTYDITGKTEVSSGSLSYVDPDKKYYFVAVAYREDSTNRIDATPYVLTKVDGTVVKYGRYNDFTISSQISATKYISKPSKPSTKSEKTKITMTFSKSNAITGYQIYRKNAKGKYVKITTTTSRQYVDKNLKENTTYSYKARAYAYNPVTKKITYSEYVYFSAETSTNNYITVKAEKKSKNSAKITWTKVAGATKYEIYRTSTASTDSVYSEKNSAASNSKWRLIKTITKAKTTSYTDKKLNTGETYKYKVIAYYKAGSQIREINDEDTVVLELQQPQNVVVMLSGSSVKVSWDADKYAAGYEVRYYKYNNQGKAYTEEPVVVSTKKASYSIGGLKAGEKVSVSVRATNGKKWTNWTSYTSETMRLPSVTGVTAKNVTVKDTNGVETKKVQITWKAVPGAAFYRVWRSTSPEGRYNTDTKLYDIPADNVGISKESNTDENYASISYTEYKGKSGSIVGTSAIDGAKLQPGVTYYYYVTAYAENEVARSYDYIKGAKVTFDATAKIKSAKATKGKVTLTINKVTGAGKYVVYRSTKKSSGYKQIGTTKKTTYVDKKVKKGKTYYYKVVAVGVNGLKADFETGMSSAVKVKAK